MVAFCGESCDKIVDVVYGCGNLHGLIEINKSHCNDWKVLFLN